MHTIERVRQILYSVFSPEIELLRRFLDTYPLLSVGIIFLSGVIVGGLLSTWPSQFVLLALLGGYGLAIAQGSIIGLPSYLSAALVVPILAFATYASLGVLRSIDQYPRTARHLTRLKSKYYPISNYLLAHAGPIGITGILAFSTFLVGWWVTVMIAYLLNVEVSSTMKGTTIGLAVGAFVFWVSFQGMSRWLPNPIMISAFILIVFFAMGRLMLNKAKHPSQPSPTL
jgi:hypothetical protein